jgi:hypothetical protein
VETTKNRIVETTKEAKVDRADRALMVVKISKKSESSEPLDIYPYAIVDLGYTGRAPRRPFGLLALRP